MTSMDTAMRIWIYFRTGYATYMSYPLSIGSNIVLFYALLIKQYPVLSAIFPDIVGFAVCMCLIAGPAAVALGYVHYKKLPAFSQEQKVYAESSPYYVDAQAVYAALSRIGDAEGLRDTPEIRHIRELCHDGRD